MTDFFNRKLAAEAIGTLVLVATVIGSGIMAENLSGGNVAVALLANALATGAMLYVLITILGPISGAHFNPVVSAVMVLRRDLALPDAVAYALAQIVGGIAGAILANAMFDLEALQVSTKSRGGVGQLLSEAVATFSLIGAIYGGLRYRKEAVPMLVALTIVAAYWFTASTSFANPAVTIAREFSNTFAGISPLSVPGFLIAQVVGGCAAHYLWSWMFRPHSA